MSPMNQAELPVFGQIAAGLRSWAGSMERHAAMLGAAPLGPPWPDEDLAQLYAAWLEVGRAIRDVARTRPEPGAAEPRPELLAIRDGLARIAEIVARQTPPA